MTDKQKLIIDYLTDHNCEGYYVEIRDSISKQFDDEQDFDKTLDQLTDLNLIYENDKDFLYKLTFPDLKIIYAIPHVTLFYTDKDEPLLRIEDYELFDTFDDILTEQFSINDYSHSIEEVGNLKIITIYFSQHTDKDNLNKAIKSIDKKEVERIYRKQQSE